MRKLIVAASLSVVGLVAACRHIASTHLTGWDMVPEILARIVPPQFPAREFNVMGFGAVADGSMMCTNAFRNAIDACAEAGGGTVTVPAGKYLTGPIHLRSGVNLNLAEGAEIIFSDNFEDYLPVVLVRVGGVELYNYSPLIYARGCTNIAVTGKGKLNGNAKKWWPWSRRETRAGFEMGAKGVPVEQRVFGTPEAAIRPSFLSFIDCTNILLSDFTIGGGPNWTIHPIYCVNTTIRGVQVITEGPNNDGIDPDSCRDMLIEQCTFSTGDDCVVLKSGYNEDGWRVGIPTENVLMRNCFSRRGHGGLVIGSEMSGSVRNVFMEDCQFEGTDRAIRIKSRGDRGGVVENVYARNLRVKNMRYEAIILNMDYTADRNTVLLAKPPLFQNMHFENITGSSVAAAIRIQGMSNSLIANIRCENMDITSNKGVIANHVKGLMFENVQVRSAEGPVFQLDNTTDVIIKGSSAPKGTALFLQLNGSDSRSVMLENCDLSQAAKPFATGPGVAPNAVQIK